MKKQATNVSTAIIQPQRIGVGFRTLGLIFVLILLAPGNVLAQGGPAPEQAQAELAASAQPAAPAAPAGVTSWTNAAGGNWDVAGNWDNGVPGAGDDAIINLAGTYTVIMNVDATVSSLTLGGASGIQTLDANGKTLTLNSASTVNSNGVLDLNSGDLAGNGDLTVDGTLNWTGGTSTISGAGALTVNGSMTINASPNPDVYLDGRTLTLSNTGTATWTGWYMRFENGAVFDNQGTFDIQDAIAISDYGGTGTNRFDNSGTVTKSAGALARIYVAFNNTGSVNVNSGTLALNGGGTHGSSFNVSAGNTLQFGGGTHSLGDGTTFGGDGKAEIAGGTVNTDGTGTGTTVNASATLALSGGTLGGNGKLTVNGTFDWSGGTSYISGSGEFTVNGSMTINASPNPDVYLDGRTLTLSNTGTATWTGWYMRFKNGAVFDNQGTFDIQDAIAISDYGGTGTNRFDNSGTVTKSAGTWTTIYVAFNNTGMVNVNSGTLQLNGDSTHNGSTINVNGGTLQITSDSTFDGSNTLNVSSGNTLELHGHIHTNSGAINVTGDGAVGFYGGATFNNQSGATFDIRADGTLQYLGSTAPNFNNAGTLTRSTSGGTATVDVNFNNTGTVEAQSGVLNFTRQYVQTAGITRLNGGDLSSTQTVDIQGGVLEGFGTVTGDVSNAGQVSPGLSPAILNIDGDYTQTSAGSLNIELGGYTAGTDFDQLKVSGNATLNGTLDVTLINNFEPSGDDTFLILDGTSTGTFHTTNLPALPPRLQWEVIYSSVTLKVAKSDTTTTITSDNPDPSVVGQPVEVQYTVVATVLGSGTPTGNVTVDDGDGNSCTASVAAGSCSLTPTSAGAKTLTATYAGDANFNGSSDTEAHQVNKADTTTTITSDSPDPSVVSQAVTVIYTVTVDTPGSGTPTGNVTVDDGDGNSCTASVAAGSCSLTPTSAGAKTLTATYAGDSNFNTSSATESHQVNPSGKTGTTTTIASDDPDPSVVGQPVEVKYTVVPKSGSGTPTGNVTVHDGEGNSCTGTVADGKCTLTPTSAGAKTLTATYGGDSNFNGSSDTEEHTVNERWRPVGGYGEPLDVWSVVPAWGVLGAAGLLLCVLLALLLRRHTI